MEGAIVNDKKSGLHGKQHKRRRKGAAVQVYNNIATSSVWKNYTSNAEYLRKSITKLTGEAQEKKNVQDAPTRPILRIPRFYAPDTVKQQIMHSMSNV